MQHNPAVCQIQLTNLVAAKLQLLIKYEYYNNWILDNLPSANLAVNNGKEQKRYSGGFPIGVMSRDQSKAYIYSHVNINVDYHRQMDRFRVVGFAVEGGLSFEGHIQPSSTCPAAGQHVDSAQLESLQIVAPNENVIFTYDVMWRESEVAWSSRWQIYLTEDNLVPAEVHWYSYTNSISVVVFLALYLSILMRRRDIAAYSTLAALSKVGAEEAEDEMGWKSLHADVFHPPTTMPMLYCVFVGTGVQLGLALFCIIVFSALGYLSPARRGSLMNASLAFCMICSVFSGYVSSRLYKAFHGHLYQRCTILTATLFPGCAFGMFLFFNIFMDHVRCVRAAPSMAVVTVAAMWLPFDAVCPSHLHFWAPTLVTRLERWSSPPSPLPWQELSHHRPAC